MAHLLDRLEIRLDLGEERREVLTPAEAFEVALGRGPADTQDVGVRILGAAGQFVVHATLGLAERPGGPQVRLFEFRPPLFADPVSDVFDNHARTEQHPRTPGKG